SSATAGLVVGTASADISFARLSTEQPPSTPLVVTRSTNGLAGNSGPAVKREVNAKITIAPSAVNEVGQSHTFTVTVLQDDGLNADQGGDGVTGFTAAVGALVDVTLDGQNGAVPDVSAPTDLAPADPSTLLDLVTDANGQVKVTFSAATAGLVVGTASADISFARLSTEQPPSTPLVVTRSTNGLAGNSGPAVKREVNAKISIAPSAVNEVGQSHTFTV